MARQRARCVRAAPRDLALQLITHEVCSESATASGARHTLRALVRMARVASKTSASARHSSCARGLRPAASRRKEPLMSNNKAVIALHAHEMRQARTDSEARLWRALRSSQLGVAFRRQVPLLGFIADFYASVSAPRISGRKKFNPSRVCG